MIEYILVLAVAIDRLLALGQKLKFNGTPTIVFTDGNRASDFIPATELENAMAAPDGQK